MPLREGAAENRAIFLAVREGARLVFRAVHRDADALRLLADIEDGSFAFGPPPSDVLAAVCEGGWLQIAERRGAAELLWEDERDAEDARES